MVAQPEDLVRGQPGSATSDPSTGSRAIQLLRKGGAGSGGSGSTGAAGASGGAAGGGAAGGAAGGGGEG